MPELDPSMSIPDLPHDNSGRSLFPHVCGCVCFANALAGHQLVSAILCLLQLDIWHAVRVGFGLVDRVLVVPRMRTTNRKPIGVAINGCFPVAA